MRTLKIFCGLIIFLLGIMAVAIEVSYEQVLHIDPILGLLSNVVGVLISLAGLSQTGSALQSRKSSHL